MNIIRKNIVSGTWQWTVEPLSAIAASHIRESAIYLSHPMLYFDNDDPATDWIELDEGKELLECGDCCEVRPRDHRCERDVPPTINLPANPYDHSEAR